MSSNSAAIHLCVMNALIIYFILRLYSFAENSQLLCVSCSMCTLLQNLYLIDVNIPLSITVPDNLWPLVTHSLTGISLLHSGTNALGVCTSPCNYPTQLPMLLSPQGAFIMHASFQMGVKEHSKTTQF